MNLFLLFDIVAKSFIKITTFNNKVNLFDLGLFRSVGHTMFGTILLIQKGKHPLRDLPSEYRWTLFWRSALGTVGYFMMQYSLKYLPIFIVQIIFNTAPFHASIFAYFINGESITRTLLFCMICCFVGICIVSLARSGIFDSAEEAA